MHSNQWLREELHRSRWLQKPGVNGYEINCTGVYEKRLLCTVVIMSQERKSLENFLDSTTITFWEVVNLKYQDPGIEHRSSYEGMAGMLQLFHSW